MHTLIHWWTRNHIAANFLMFALFGLGFMSWFKLRKEIFPEFSTNYISITVPYPGATPEEVEKGVCVPVEEAVHGVDGIKRITSRAGEGSGGVYVQVDDSFDVQEVLNKVKSRVDAIRIFPENAEKPIIEDIPIRMQVLSVAVTAPTDEKNLRAVAERVRDGMLNLEGVTQVEFAGVKNHEISVEVSEDTLRAQGLTFARVAEAVRAASLDLPAGSVRTEAGEILIRSQQKKYTAADFETIPVLARPDGTRVLLRDVARVVDGFEEVDLYTRFDGKPAIVINVSRTGDEDSLEVAKTVKDWLKDAPLQLPEGVKLEVWNDLSLLLQGRLDLMIDDAISGFILVYIMLSLFLRPALAFHVGLGIPIAFFGGLLFMQFFGVTINMISLFAFILVLGIVTDDAIVVGENVYERMRKGEPAKLAAPRGAYEVMIVAIFGVFTVIVAFLPMAFVSGPGGKVWMNIPGVVIPVLIVSLIETNFILPAHLAHLKPERPLNELWWGVRWIVALQRAITAGTDRFIASYYKRFMDFCLRNRYATLAAFTAMLMCVAGYATGGWMKFEFMPQVEGEVISGKLVLANGAPAQKTAEVIDRMEKAAWQLNEHFKGRNGEPIVKHTMASLGSQPFKVGFSPPSDSSGGHIGEVTMELLAAADRDVRSNEILKKWRELVGPIPGVVSLSFLANTANSGNAFDLEVHGPDEKRAEAAASALVAAMAQQKGVVEPKDSRRDGKRELKITLTPRGEALGLTQEYVSLQVRQAFYGAEVQRLQRGRDEVKVMVRYPEAERRSVANLSSMKIRLPDGTEVPFAEVAEATEGRGYAGIYRADRTRAINISADIDHTDPEADVRTVIAALEGGIFKELKQKYPEVSWAWQGQQKDQRANMTDLAVGGLLAICGIYVLLAIPLRSYVQPLIVMSVIPFSIMGAIIGHIVMGIELSLMTMIGVIALCGVVVNESLVLVEYVNRNRRAGQSVIQAAREAGAARFQPIMLTSVTSFIGVMPIITETSLQAKFLVPCAIALAFGCLSNLFNCLILLPNVYAILEDMKNRLFTPEKRQEWEEREREEAKERGVDWLEEGRPEAQ